MEEKAIIFCMKNHSCKNGIVPKTCLKEIKKIKRGFIWDDIGEEIHIHTFKWDTIAQKKNNHGLRFKNLLKMNKTRSQAELEIEEWK